MTETGVDAKHNFCFASEGKPESHIALALMQIPLRPAVENFSTVGEAHKTGRRRYIPTIFRIHQERVVAIEAVRLVPAERLCATQRRLQIKRHSLRAGVLSQRRSRV